MANLARFFPALLTLAALTLTSIAWGQSVSLDGNQAFEVVRKDERTSQEFPNRISREDCLLGADVRYDADIHGDSEGDNDFTWVKIVPTVVGTNNEVVQVWVSESTDCSTNEARNGTSGSCRLVASTPANERNPTFWVNPRDLVARGQLVDWEPTLELDESICTMDSNQVDLPISIQVIISTGIETAHDSVQWTDTSLDLRAPSAPDDITVGAGDGHIFFEWDIDSESEDPETNGFVFYCVPSGTQESGGDIEGEVITSPAGGAGGAGSASCSQTIISAGDFASALALEYECGEVAGRSARRGQADGLRNNISYAVGVAATDVVGNAGVLSEIQCRTPSQVTTFFEGYTEAGGQGGGGFCQSTPSNAGSLWWLSLLTGAALMFRRRRARS